MASNIDGVEVKRFRVHKDNRGVLFEILRSDEEFFAGFGQVYAVRAYPGESRGGHYHKKTTDYFALIDGVCSLFLVDLRPGRTIGNRWRIRMNSDSESHVGVFIPPRVWHRIDAHREHGFIGIGIPSLPYDQEAPDTIEMPEEKAIEMSEAGSVDDYLLGVPEKHGARMGRLGPGSLRGKNGH